MNTELLTISYDKTMTPDLVDAFEKKIYYISEKIVSFRRVYAGDSIVGVELTILGEYDEDEIRRRVSEILSNEIIGLKDVRMNRVWDNDASTADSEKVLQECLAKKLVFLPSEGQISLRGMLVKLFDFFDSVFKEISVEFFACENYRFPTLLKTSALKKAGYFESFPNLLMFASRLKNEISNYNAFKNAFNTNIDDEEIVQSLLTYCCSTDYGLPPTMCYYVYDMLSGQAVNNQAFTARGKSFRYENKYQKPFERLWDFTIRETVFIGDKKYAEKGVQDYRDYAIRLMELLNLKGFCETANDPFFLVNDTTKKINVQKMMGSKYELRLRINPENTMAVGSFNVHGQFISKRFHLFANENKREYCYTGCIGIGLERMLFGFLAQYGCDESNWPAIVREGIDDFGNIRKIIQKLKISDDSADR